jgi:hypothetical protein
MREMLSGVDPCDQSRADIALFRRRCCSRLGTPSVVPRTPRSVVRRSMFPNPVVHARSETPRTRSLLQSRFPRQLVQSCLGSARARPAALTYLSMPRDQRARDASGRRMQSTCQRRAPVISASFPDSGSRGPSSSPEDGARHTATARFGLCFAARASVVYPLRHAAKPGPLMSPSPLAVHRARGPASCDRPRSLPPPPSVIGLRLRRPGNTFHPQRSPSRTLPRRSTALSAERRLTPAVSPVAVFAA